MLFRKQLEAQAPPCFADPVSNGESLEEVKTERAGCCPGLLELCALSFSEDLDLPQEETFRGTDVTFFSESPQRDLWSQAPECPFSMIVPSLK